MADKGVATLFNGCLLAAGWCAFVLMAWQHTTWHRALILGTCLTGVAVGGAFAALGLVALHDRYNARRRDNPFDTDGA